MNTNLASLIESYLKAVKTAVELIHCSGITLPKTNTEWVCTDTCHITELNGGIGYFKHGFGCAVRLNSGVVDFDFGTNGEISGFEVSRLWAYAKSSQNTYGFKNENDLKNEFNQAIENEEIKFSGYILYYCSTMN